MCYEAIVIGVSAGGLNALSLILPQLPADYGHPVIIVQHRTQDDDQFLSDHLNSISEIFVKEAEPGEPIRPAHVYIAPPGYHLLVEREKTFSLNLDGKVNHAIPSIDVLFESAATAYEHKLVGIILTGANSDGCNGLARIKSYGGLTITQDASTAASPFLPQMAARLVEVDHVLSLDAIATFLKNLLPNSERYEIGLSKRVSNSDQNTQDVGHKP